MGDPIFTTTAEKLASYDGKAFDAEPILHSAEHAVAVYRDAAGYALAATTRARFDGATVIELGPEQVGLAWSKELIVITPRGSDELADWLGNLATVIRVRWRGILPDDCRVGLGFKRQAVRLGGPLLEFLRGLIERYPDAQIVIAGHSLGAALVPLLVAFLDAHGIRCRLAVPHESPRAGNVAFGAWYDERYTFGAVPTWSIVNVSNGEHDIVTRIPKKRWGFRHVGRRAILDDGSVLFGDDAWKAHRDENPVGHTVAAWRIVTRFYLATASAVQAHYGRSLLASLRRLIVS